MTIATTEEILTEAHEAARVAVQAEIARQPEDMNAFDCGFAWVTIPATGAFILGCKKASKEQDYETRKFYGSKDVVKGWTWWKPGAFNGQSIRIHEVGAEAFAKVLTDHGIPAHMSSRLD